MQTKTKKTNIPAAAALLLFVLVTVGTAVGLRAVSKNYAEIYGTPRLSGCTLDLEGYDTDNRRVDYNLAGEWEFFYRRFIVTDGDDAPPDGKISLPCRYADAGYGIGGHASYRIYIENAAPGTKFTVVLNNFAGAFRAFINGVPVAVCGTVSETIGETYAPGRVTQSTPYTVGEGERLELVVEVGASAEGGLYSVPWLSTGFTSDTATLSNTMTFIIVFILGGMVFSFLSSLMFGLGLSADRRPRGFSFLLFSLILNEVTSKDCTLILTAGGIFADYRIYRALCFFSLLLIFLCLLGQFRRIGALPMKKQYILLPPPLCFALSCALFFTKWQFLPMILAGAFLTYAVGRLCFSTHIPRSVRVLYYGIALLFSMVSVIELSDGMGLLVFGTEALVSLLLFGVLLIADVLQFLEIRRLRRAEILSVRFRASLDVEREKSLRAQIKPHFVFNTLTCIEDLYHRSLSDGDAAMHRFSEFLRANVDFDGKRTVPLEEELDYTETYFSLANMNAGGHVTLYYDIDFPDVEVPILTLQPFVENSMRHGRLSEREDGYIRISSSEEGGMVTLAVEDNGVGFDPAHIGAASHGIRNAEDRLTALLGAAVTVTSAPGQGTKVTVTFPLGKEAKTE